jgi:predicted small metal-binding protein
MRGSSAGEATVARTLRCDCGKVLIGQDDEELFRLARQHVTEDHDDRVMSDGQIRDLVAANARDA